MAKRPVDNADWPERIKRLRESLGLTQDELARRLGYAGKGSVANFELGLRVPTGPARLLLAQLEAEASVARGHAQGR